MQIEMIRLQARAFFSRFIKSEAGITAIEYAVLAAGVAGLIAVVAGTDGSIKTAIDSAFAKVTTAVGGGEG